RTLNGFEYSISCVESIGNQIQLVHAGNLDRTGLPPGERILRTGPISPAKGSNLHLPLSAPLFSLCLCVFCPFTTFVLWFFLFWGSPTTRLPAASEIGEEKLVRVRLPLLLVLAESWPCWWILAVFFCGSERFVCPRAKCRRPSFK
ncbi:hypothetical protein M5D96_012775, partial [Drosophila gunungcola]